MAIWDNNEACSSKQDFLRKNNNYRNFISNFIGKEWTIADLSKGNNELGFAWGKFDFNQHLERHPTELIWIMKNKKRGLLSRLFGQ